MTKEGTRIEFLVGPRAGRTAIILKANPDNATQWLVELDDGTALKVGKDKIAAHGAPLEGKPARVATWDCSVCTLINSVDARECAACGTPFVPGGSASGTTSTTSARARAQRWRHDVGSCCG